MLCFRARMAGGRSIGGCGGRAGLRSRAALPPTEPRALDCLWGEATLPITASSLTARAEVTVASFARSLYFAPAFRGSRSLLQTLVRCAPCRSEQRSRPRHRRVRQERGLRSRAVLVPTGGRAPCCLWERTTLATAASKGAAGAWVAVASCARSYRRSCTLQFVGASSARDCGIGGCGRSVGCDRELRSLLQGVRASRCLWERAALATAASEGAAGARVAVASCAPSHRTSRTPMFVGASSARSCTG
jgi:hypothetical protein